MKQSISYLLYPLILLIATISYLLTYQVTHLHLLSAYTSISTAAIIIITLEKFYPLHHEWIPDKQDLIVDVLFYSLIVQIVFPVALYYVEISALDYLKFKNGIIIDIWPTHWPKLLQLIFFATIGEFFQYCWHRACHTYTLLWPIHAPHHFPKKLYSWNTSKFHFLDKFIEFTFTVFIFIPFGLPLEIFSYYYVFYAIIGYFQHSNLDVKFGWFDYIFASAQTHRFHHDSNLALSKCNYANNLVLFDILFTTFKRRPDIEIKIVGVRAGKIPTTLKEEILYPLNQFNNYFFKLILQTSMSLVAKKKCEKLKQATNNPKKYQNELLLRMLAENANTVFGIKHDFKNIKSAAVYKQKVPIQDYESFRPYIEMILKGKLNTLSKDQPFYFTKTSGTTGKPKYIPIDEYTITKYKNSQQILSYALYSKNSNFLDGEVFSIVGNEIEEILEDKWPCGSMSGKLYTLAHPLVREKNVFHYQLSKINDSNKKYLYLATLALLSPNVTFYVSPNPSSLLKIFDVINSNRDQLILLIQNENDPLLAKNFHNASRALKLLKNNQVITIDDIWPNLITISLWKQGSCSYLIPKIQNMIGPKTVISELGYLSSEFYGTLPIGPDTNIQVPTLLDNYFEFIEKSDYENGNRETLELHELKLNHEYYIIVSTFSCFYRYFINDVIKVTGFENQSPVIVFSHKGKGITNLTGEKISEKQIIGFFHKQNLIKFNFGFFICLADQINQNYKLYVESIEIFDLKKLQTDLDQYLKSENIEFASKRSDQRLKEIEIIQLVPGTSDLYKEHCIKKGQSDTQFKFLFLQYLQNVDFPFEKYIK